MIDWPRIVVLGAVSYAAGSYCSYKYGKYTKAMETLSQVTDQRTFLRERHDAAAETYDEEQKRMEFSNKLGKYRRTLLSYAEGRVLEVGIGTGSNLRYYQGGQVSELVGVDWSEQMLMKAFGRLDELREEQKLQTMLTQKGIPLDEAKDGSGLPPVSLPEKVKLMRADCLDLDVFPDGSFDTVVDTLTLNSVYNREQHTSEIRRLCRPGGLILLLERGHSHVSVYNQWLQFRAAKDLVERGSVEHLDIEKVVRESFGDLKVVHTERKNFGMTYVYIIENSAAPEKAPSGESEAADGGQQSEGGGGPDSKVQKEEAASGTDQSN